MTTKIRQLPITDLARIATLHPDARRAALKQVREGGGQGSYEPTRRKLPDIVNRQPGVFVGGVRAPWEKIREDIKRIAKTEKEEKMNVRASRAIYDYCHFEGIKAIELDAFPLSFSMGLKLTCWAPSLFIYPNRIALPFFDMRRKLGLTPKAVSFIFSVMNIAVRESNPRYEEVELEALRLANSSSRGVQRVTERGVGLYSYGRLEQMVSETHALWMEIQEERKADKKRDDDHWGPETLFGG